MPVSEATTPRLKVSREGIVLIKSFEGLRPRAVKTQAGGWVIGYGHTASAREGLTVGEADAELLLQYDLLPIVKALNERVAARVNQHQFDALASFALSVGIDRFLSSDVLERLNGGHAGEAADALIGWPESLAPDARLRRRAAERALFVADPNHAVLLADLLAAPLPPPEIETLPPVAAPEPDARAAAVASLLGETPTEPVAGEPEAAAPSPTSSILLERHSPYSATVVGPLAGFPPHSPPADEQPVEPVNPDHASVGPTESIPQEPLEAPRNEAGVHTPTAPVSAEPGPDLDFAAEPRPFPEAAPIEAMPFSAGTAPSPFPPFDAPLVLTPASESDFAEAARPTWTPEQRVPDTAVEETVLFEDEPSLSVMRHEVEPAQPKRFDWSGTGAYMVMGGLGLASCAFSAAGFRLSVTEPSPMGETTVVAWALALIGVICVGVSSWNLYVRWGHSD